MSSNLANDPGNVLERERHPSDLLLKGPGAASEHSGATFTPAIADERDLPLCESEIERITQSRHDAPSDILGPHAARNGSFTVVRALLPHARHASVRILGAEPGQYPMRRIHEEGLFEATLRGHPDALDYDLQVHDAQGNTTRIRDPYRFRDRWFTTDDERLFVEGKHARLFEKLGAHPGARKGIRGVSFAVWAPHAQRVSVVGTFNRWDGRSHQMQRFGPAGIWELFVPDVSEGELYKYEIKTADHAVFLKADPFAVCTEHPPATASVVLDLTRQHVWRDPEWMRQGRVKGIKERGVRAYLLEAMGLEDGPSLLPAEVTEDVIAAVEAQGYTHVELVLPPTGRGSASLFAFGADSRVKELMAFVELCHRHAVGVVLPVAGSCFPGDLDELAWFDGTPIYETLGEASAQARLFDLNQGEVRSFLLSHAAFWLDRYHIDGLRTDRPGALLYRDLLHRDREAFAGVRLLVSQPATAVGLSEGEVARIVDARHDDPYAVLGPHDDQDARRLTVRAMAPGAEAVQVLLEDEPEVVIELQAIHAEGLFSGTISEARPHYRLRIVEPGGHARELVDPYALRDFIFKVEDQHLFAAGNHYHIYDRLGAHPRTIGAVEGVSFAVWAPNAQGVSVVGPFNRWDGRVHQMTRHGLSGVWEIFVPGIGEGEIYQYEIRARNGHVLLKSDPLAFSTQAPPATASIVCLSEDAHVWRDRDWMEKRRTTCPWERPIAIYEVHLASWMRGSDHRPLSYRDLATRLVSYVKALGFTHIELLPIAEHPYEPSWGYQVSNFYAPTARLGAPKDLMEFVDQCHQSGIGVILDWVAGHFPKDEHALAWFDGTHLYEHADPRQGEHPDWGTLIFNYGRHEVENFLIANALFWLEKYHFDGLRVDAVASMLYLDYSRLATGEWIPNRYGGRENLEAIEFLKHTNSIVHARYPGVMMIAEESTAWPHVSRPADQGGLGFGFKWNMGWMHDVLAYMRTPPAERRHHHHRLTFGLMYAFSENFILSLSHDEVVHMKGSLLNKMPGDAWERFANLRLLFTFLYGHPGKKLLFMGGEFGQESEWDHSRGLEWRLLASEPYRRLSAFLRDLHRLYRSERAFFEVDSKAVGFEWLEVDNAEESIVAFLRKAKDPRNALLFAMNFSTVSRPEHRIGVPYPVRYREVFNSNAYGGLGRGPKECVDAEEVPWHGREFSIRLSLPALSAVILKPAPSEVAVRSS